MQNLDKEDEVESKKVSLDCVFCFIVFSNLWSILASTIINYDSRVVLTRKLVIFTTLG